jgi:hypothetical protein
MNESDAEFLEASLEYAQAKHAFFEARAWMDRAEKRFFVLADARAEAIKAEEQTHV